MSSRARRVRPDRSSRSRGQIAQLPWGPVVAERPPIEVLDDDQIERLHDASLKVLRDTGMRILDPDTRRRFERAGAAVDGDRVRLDPEMVVETIATAPSTFTLRARNPERTLTIGGAHRVFAAISGPAFCSDLDRGRRQGTLADLTDFAKLIQSLNIVHQEGGGSFEPMDLPANTRHLDQTAAVIEHIDKNFQGTALGRHRAADCVDLAAIALGTDRDGLAADPAIMAIVNTNTPLTLDVPMAQGLYEYSSNNQAIAITPFTLAGAMAPATVAGALVLQNAECLAGIALTQLIRPGAPVMYGSFTSNVDMRSGSPAFGTPEYTIAAQAGGQLARRYGIPYRSSNTTAANTVDSQASYESAMSLFGSIMGGANLVNHAAGWLEGGLTASFEKLVIDAEQLQMMTEYLRPIVIDDDTLGLSAIDEVGPGGHFFGAAHTLERFETAFYTPMVSDWRNFETWSESGSVDAARRANAIWKQLVAEYETPPMAAGVREAIAEFVARRKIELAGIDH